MLTSEEDCDLEAEMILLGAKAVVKKSQNPKILLAWCENFYMSFA